MQLRGLLHLIVRQAISVVVTGRGYGSRCGATPMRLPPSSSRCSMPHTGSPP